MNITSQVLSMPAFLTPTSSHWINEAEIIQLWSEIDSSASSRSTAIKSFMTKLGIATVTLPTADQRGLERLLRGAFSEHELLSQEEQAGILVAALNSKTCDNGISIGDWLRIPDHFLSFLSALRNPHDRECLCDFLRRDGKGRDAVSSLSQRSLAADLYDYKRQKMSLSELLRNLGKSSMLEEALQIKRQVLEMICTEHHLVLNQEERIKFDKIEELVKLLAQCSCQLESVIALLPVTNTRSKHRAILIALLERGIMENPTASSIYSKRNNLTPDNFYTNWMLLKKLLLEAPVQSASKSPTPAVKRLHISSHVADIERQYNTFKATEKRPPTPTEFNKIVRTLVSPPEQVNEPINHVTMNRFLATHSQFQILDLRTAETKALLAKAHQS